MSMHKRLKNRLSDLFSREDTAIWIWPAVSFITHLTVICLSLIYSRPEELLVDDSVTYYVPAKNIVENGAFWGIETGHFLWEPYRTIGYPLLIAASIRIFGDFRYTLFLAAITSAISALYAQKSLKILSGNKSASIICGVLFATFPPSLVYSGELKTDALFGHLSVVCFYFILKAVSVKKEKYLYLAALFAVLMQSLKPSMNAFFPLLLLMALFINLLSRQRIIRIRTLFALAMITTAMPLFSIAMIYRDYGVLTHNMQGVKTARQYFMANYYELFENKDWDAAREIIKKQDIENAGRMKVDKPLAARVFLVEDIEVKKFLSDHYVAAVAIVLYQSVKQLLSPRSDYFYLSKYLKVVGVIISIAMLVFFIFGMTVIWRNGMVSMCIVSLLFVGYFVFLGSISAHVASRLIIPSDLAMMIISSIGISTVTNRMIICRTT